MRHGKSRRSLAARFDAGKTRGLQKQLARQRLRAREASHRQPVGSTRLFSDPLWQSRGQGPVIADVACKRLLFRRKAMGMLSQQLDCPQTRFHRPIAAPAMRSSIPLPQARDAPQGRFCTSSRVRPRKLTLQQPNRSSPPRVRRHRFEPRDFLFQIVPLSDRARVCMLLSFRSLPRQLFA